jgi:hypothetical protein
MKYLALDKVTRRPFDPGACEEWEIVEAQPRDGREGFEPGLVLHSLYRTGDGRYVEYQWIYELERVYEGLSPHVRTAVEIGEERGLAIRESLGAAPDGPPPPSSHPDGPEAGRWLWWKGKRHDISKGVIYQLLEYMWGRDSASYDSLVGPVFNSDMMLDSIRARASEASRILEHIGIPWRLSADGVNRYLVKCDRRRRRARKDEQKQP